MVTNSSCFKRLRHHAKRTKRRIRVIGSRIKRKLIRRPPIDYKGNNEVPSAPRDANSFEREQRIYREYTANLLKNQHDPDAYARAIGSSSASNFELVGKMEADLLFQYGLNDNSVLVDVGCGSGRLAKALSKRFNGKYIGTEISADLLSVAVDITNRPDFRFIEIEGFEIPVDDNSTDMVCFFSVLTHLRHEESYLYLENAVRTLRTGGLIVFSYLDFSQPSHWAQFEPILNLLRTGQPFHVNQMISKDAIAAWAQYLQVEIVAVHDGEIPHINNSTPKHPDQQDDLQSLGQSVCVLRKTSN